MNQNIAWTIAGSDSSGGAGIQTDLKTFQNLGVHGCSVITAVTAQNNLEINEIQYLPPESVAAQINSLKNHFTPKAIKIGMLGNSSAIEKIINFLSDYSGHVVLDPLITSTSGKNLFNKNLKNYISQMINTFYFVDVITPNIPEVEKILNCKLKSYQDIENSAKEILSLGVKSILIKGGHFEHDTLFSQDYWTNGLQSFWLSNKRFPQCNYRGTGCALSSAITACLALGYNITDAVVIAKMYVNRGIRLSKAMQHNSALLAHSHWPEEEIDLPYLTYQPIYHSPEKFIETDARVGLYPVIDSIEWLKKLLPLGVKSVQLRIKNKQGLALENEIEESIKLAQKYQAKLFINDYWEHAVRYSAYGVHLGQADLNTADINIIRKANLRLGISTHCYYEVARAHSLKPSYIACGPVFETTSKIMPFPPLGISQLCRLRKTLNYPLVAIGGISVDKINAVIQTGVAGIAMISAITRAQDPIATTKKLLIMINNNYVTHTR